jgi:predicted ATP-dependent protease
MIGFTKEKAAKGAKEEATDKSVHEVIRKAIRCCDGDDNITLSLESAMGLVREWDEAMRKM